MDSQEPDHIFTPADRIRQLNEIDKDVTKLLNAAGVAISSLTNSSVPPAGEQSSNELPKIDGTLESHQAAFKAASSQYFALLSSIDVRLRRQVYALEEASIIKPESAETVGGTVTTTAAAATAGGVNPLDTSWLNSRKDTVGKDKEAELWAEASKLATQLEKDKGTFNSESGGADKNDVSEGNMEVD
ncbi:hypothetical protein AJ79_06317 [Helicocarpus griseus UAMH5409]|uniref:Mediator of RNA polymerase II transcription subunit 11 n=1 Tax=Helicocarpus griseus UAMH5409 TaxID=1447875 RepID=A0A2B7XEP0_9EURO|nr:hypothetical protein AJ79_06317 [Helicocarpus griseus UAMH5409]